MATFHVISVMACIFLNLKDLLACEELYMVVFDARNKCLTPELLKQGYRYHKLRKAFSEFNV